MRKRDIFGWFLVFLSYVIAISLALWVYSYLDTSDKNPDRYKLEASYLEPMNCQYPGRSTNTATSCDNTDPACPETIKEDGGFCLQQPLEEVNDGLAGK